MNNSLIDSIKNGNKESFKLVFDMHFNALCSFAYKYIPSMSEVEDLVQDVFINFWENRQNFDNINALKAFLYNSVRNKCLNYLKHKSVQKKHESAIVYELESDHIFANHIIEEETFSQLYCEINKLPESAQKIMLLALKGLKNREIAQKLSISENTVKTQKKIAYSKLKLRLSPVLNAILLSL